MMSNLMESATIEEPVSATSTVVKGPKKAISKSRKSKKIFKRIDSEEELDDELAQFIDNSTAKKKRTASKRGYVDKKLQKPTVKRSYPKRERKNITV
jgi:hypothetical protein